MRGYFLILSALAVWSTWGLAVRWLGKPVPVIIFYNALFALIFQGAALLAIGRRRDLHLGRGLAAILLLGVSSLANVLCFFYSLKVITVAGALLTHYTAPIFVAFLAPLLLKDRMGRATLVALFISLAGLVLIFFRGMEIAGTVGLLGVLAGTASGLAYAFVIIISRGITSRHHPLKLCFYQSLLGVLALALFVLPSGEAGITLSQGLLLTVLGLVHSTVANVLYFYGMREATAQEAGVLGYIEPVLAITLAYLFLGETPHLLAIAGGALIVFSGLIVIKKGGGAGVGAILGGMYDNRG